MAITSSKMLATLVLMCLCATLICLSPLRCKCNAQAMIPNYVPLYVFGDSLVDTGMGLYVDRGPEPANAWPYGETYFKKPAGRFSDGRLIPDFIAEFAYLPFPVPYANPNLTVTGYTQAVNFANAAAGVLVETREEVHPMYMKVQTECYVEMTQKFEQEYGKQETTKLLSKAIHLINIGANDCNLLYNQSRNHVTPTLLNQFTNEVLGNMSMNLKTMYNKGARKFVFLSIGPMGCNPKSLQANGSCSEELNRIVKTLNNGVEALWEELAQQLVGFNYIIYDLYTSLLSRTSDSASYGFTESKSACCGSGPFNGIDSCSRKGRNFTVCNNPSTYLWFDFAHPTQKADQQLAEELWGGSTPLVKPCNLRSFYVGGCASPTLQAQRAFV